MSKRGYFILSIMVATAAVVRADLAMVQTIETSTNGQNQTTTLAIQSKGDMLRVDKGEDMTLILDGRTGDMVTVMHAQKSLMRVSGQQLESMKGMVAGDQQEQATPPTLTATGKTKEVNGYKTEEYIQQNGGMEVHYWIAKDYPNYKELLAQMQKLQSGKLASINGRQSMNLLTLPGIPLQTTVTQQGAVTTATITSIEGKDVDASVFEVPAGYNEIKLPGMGGAMP